MIDPKIDATGQTIHVNEDTGMLKIDGISWARLVRRPDGIYLQVRDVNRQRSVARGTEFVEVKLEALMRQITT